MVSSYDLLHLLGHFSELKAALTDNPALVAEQDETGKTLLHYVANAARFLGSPALSQTLTLLLTAPERNFNIQDDNGNTPMHYAALCCKHHPKTGEYVFPAFIKEAVKNGFDFSKLNDEGYTVLHLATTTSFEFPFSGISINNAATVLNHAPEPGLNVLSTAGKTALSYALCHFRFQEATSLLQAGADVTLTSQNEPCPLDLIDEQLGYFHNIVDKNLAENPEQHENYQAIIVELDKLKTTMDSIIEHEKTKSSAKVLAQGKISDFPLLAASRKAPVSVDSPLRGDFRDDVKVNKLNL